MSKIYEGKAKKLDDIDLPQIGSTIDVGEDPIHALMEVETLGSGFDSQGRPKLLFEPHKFYRHLRKNTDKQRAAIRAGLAYPNWGEQKYPRESYTRLDKAMEIDAHAALLSGSWGASQIMGENHKQAGYDTVEEMVEAFADDEATHIQGMINFIKANGIDDDLRRIEQKTQRGEKVTAQDWVPIVRVYNGAGFAKNDYHNRAAKAYNKWLRIKDTPWKDRDIREMAEMEELEAESSNDVETPKDEAIEAKVEEPVTVEQQKPADPPASLPTPGINGTTIGTSVFSTTTIAAIVAALGGAQKLIIFSLVGAAVLIGAIWLISRFWYSDKDKERQAAAAEAEAKRAHEITMAKIASAKDKDSYTVEVK